ncbi:MAG: YdcF family protein [Gammaproteobacteria bacterium]|nr:YdcF family protein [Gammaproteobacteria bacterium]
MQFTVTHLIESIISPPAGPLFLIVIGVFLIRKLPRLGYSLSIAGLAVLFFASIPVISYALVDSLESGYPPLQKAPSTAQAIVVVGGGQNYNRPDFNGDTISGYGLERLRYAAHLHEMTGLPLLISGGTRLHSEVSEAALMKDVLEKEFKVEVKWLEETSNNTYENVQHMATMLERYGISSVVVVTHAWHMPRTMWAFNEVGIQATPAPTAFNEGNPIEMGVNAFLPQANALMVTRVVFHEVMGRLWYQIRY